MDVINVEQARIAEEAGACAVMALERVPADIRRDGGVARMSDPAMILAIKAAVTIPVMAKARIGHFVEAQILQSLEIDYIDESEVLTMADEENHINKHRFSVPFVCGCKNLGEALVGLLHNHHSPQLRLTCLSSLPNVCPLIISDALLKVLPCYGLRARRARATSWKRFGTHEPFNAKSAG